MRPRWAAVLLACAASLARGIGPRPALRVYDGTGRLLATVAAPDGFVLSYIHSIHLSPVDEDFSIEDDGTLRLERMLFDQLSTGMPSDDGDGFSVVGGRFAVYPKRRLERIAVSVSPVPGHRLRAGGKTRDLRGWAEPGELLVIEAAFDPRRLAKKREQDQHASKELAR